VTTCIDILSKPGLPFGASKEAAMYAVYEFEEWQSLPPEDAVDRIRRQHVGVWKGRAEMGTLLHTVNQEWVAGRSPDLNALVSAVPSWEKQIPQKIEEADRYVSDLAKFWDEYAPTDIRCEDVVRTEGVYIGSRDLVMTLKDGRRVVADIKSSAEQRSDKGLYGDSWSLQLAAYRYAREVVFYKWENKKPVIDSTEPNEPVDAGIIIHIRGNGEPMVYEVECGPEMQDAFLQCVHLHNWRKTVPNPKPLNYREVQ
jgi:hypothetical protein